MNPTPLLNRAQVRCLALELSQSTRAGKFRRVSGRFLERINDRLRALVAQEVRSHPSLGKTLK